MTISAPDQMTLSITRPPHTSVDCVQILGDVDLSDARELGLAARQLKTSVATIIYIDLAGTTFMGSTLVTFLVHIANTNGGGPEAVVLCRPTPMARKVIHMTGLDKLATVRPDLPHLWPDMIAS